MKKIFTLFFALTLLASSVFAQSCADITDADVTGGGNRINLTFSDAATSDAFLAAFGGALTATPGGAGTLENWPQRDNKLRIVGISGVTSGAYNGSITFANGVTCIFGAALDVSLTSFIGKKMETSIQLAWETASEINNNYFAVERSVDGRNFEQLTEISGQGNSTEGVTYSFEDEKPKSTTNYYRLRQVDFDGTEVFSEVISVEFKNTHLDLNLYPTMVREELNLDLTSFENEAVTINILDVKGQLLVSKTVNSNQIVTLNLSDLNLSEGMHYVRCQSINHITSGQFLVVK